MDSDKKGPVMKTGSGHFQVSIWKRNRVVAAKHDFEAERELVVVRACVQYSRWNKVRREWQNQSIWFSVDELRDLAQALDKLNQAGAMDAPASLGQLKQTVPCRV